MNSSADKRKNFLNAKSMLEKAGVPTAGILSQSYLRFEAALSTTTTLYTFDVLTNENQNPNLVTQNKLNVNDAFVISSIGIYVATAAGSTVGETNVKLFTFPDPQAFSTANAATSLRTLYNGQLQLTVGQKVYIPAWDIQKHQKVTRTQNVVGATGGTAPLDSFDMSIDGVYPCEPNVTLVGNKTNKLQVQLPGNLVAIEPNSRLVVVAYGILAQGAVKLQGGANL